MAAKLQELFQKFENSEWLISEQDINIGNKLGDGASGVTYFGHYRGEKVAIKTYSMAILVNDINSVKNEIDILSKMQHKNIVQFRGLMIRRDPPSASIVTKFAEHGELGDVLYNTRVIRRQGHPLRFKVVIGLAEGLKYLHSYNVIHRDIKPANILLDDDYEPMLTDFGFSRFFDRDSKDIMTGETGSYRYMAPEVTRHSHYSEKADVYSFALICNEVFCDERPFEHQIAAVIALDVVKKNLRPSQKRIKNECLRSIIARCWDRNPSLRPDWDEVISELKLAKNEMESDRSALSSLFRKREPTSSSNSNSTESNRSRISSDSLSSLFRKRDGNGNSNSNSNNNNNIHSNSTSSASPALADALTATTSPTTEPKLPLSSDSNSSVQSGEAPGPR